MSIFNLIRPSISAFQDLIQTASHVGAQLNLPSSPEEAQSSHWSVWTYLPAIGSGALAVAQTVGCIAHAILGNTPQAIFFGISASIAAYASICVASYVPLMSLDGYTKALASKVQQLEGTISNLKQTNNTLNSSITNLNNDLTLQQKELSKKEKLVTETLEKLQKSIDNLEVAEKKAESLQKLLDNFQKTTSNVSSKINQFVDLNKRFSCSSEELTNQLTEMQKVQQSVQLSLIDLDESQGALYHEREAAEKVASQLHNQTIHIIELLIELRKEKELLISQIDELKKNTGRLESTVDSLQTTEQRIGERTTNVKKMVEDTNTLIDRLKIVEQNIDQKKNPLRTPYQDQSPSHSVADSSKQEKLSRNNK